MAFKRAAWHSGLTYQQTCGKCHTQVTYTDHNLDFRPWYADGFIYCPTCKTPLRHNEAYALNKPTEVVAVDMTEAAPPAACTVCGRKFNPDENFCPTCGTKR